MILFSYFKNNVTFYFFFVYMAHNYYSLEYIIISHSAIIQCKNILSCLIFPPPKYSGECTSFSGSVGALSLFTYHITLFKYIFLLLTPTEEGQGSAYQCINNHSFFGSSTSLYIFDSYNSSITEI